MKQTLWCCVNDKLEDPGYYLNSFANKKADSILKFTMDTKINWESFKSLGWKCIRVEVIIKPI